MCKESVLKATTETDEFCHNTFQDCAVQQQGGHINKEYG